MSAVGKLLDRFGRKLAGQDTRPSVFIAVIGQDNFCADMAISMASMTAMPGAKIAITSRIVDITFPVTVLRNSIVEEAKAAGIFDRILFLHSDIAIPQDALSHMLEYGKRDVIGAVYRNKTPPFNMICHTMGGKPMMAPKGIVEVEVVPHGCMLVQMSTFARLKRPYFREPFAQDDGEVAGGIIPDFIDFCGRVRAAGMQVWADIDLSHSIGHVGKNLFMAKEEYGEPRAAGPAVRAA